MRTAARIIKKISTATKLQVACCVSKKINFILCGNSVATVVTRRVTSKMINSATRFVDHRRPSADIQESNLRSSAACEQADDRSGKVSVRLALAPFPDRSHHQIAVPDCLPRSSQKPAFWRSGGPRARAPGSRDPRGGVFPGPGDFLPPAPPSFLPECSKMRVFGGFSHINRTIVGIYWVYGYIQGPCEAYLGAWGGQGCPELENY